MFQACISHIPQYFDLVVEPPIMHLPQVSPQLCTPLCGGPPIYSFQFEMK